MTCAQNKNAAKCYDLAESQCVKKMKGWSCAYEAVGEEMCTAPTPAPGCCYGTSSKCATDNQAQCDKMSARAGCEWRSGHDADCTPPEPEPGSTKMLTIDEQPEGQRASHSPMLVDEEEVSKEQQARRDRIRSEVLAELERMDVETTRAVQEKFSLLNPSPASSASLLTGMSRLEISHKSQMQPKLKGEKVAQATPAQRPIRLTQLDTVERTSDQGRGIELVAWRCCNRSVCGTLWNTTCVVIVLAIWMHIVHFQWTAR